MSHGMRGKLGLIILLTQTINPGAWSTVELTYLIKAIQDRDRLIVAYLEVLLFESAEQKIVDRLMEKLVRTTFLLEVYKSE